MADPTDWGAFVEENAPKYGVDPKLARSVMQVESSGNPKAVGPPTVKGKRAVGLMQLMPETASRFGVDPSDPYQNVHGGLSLLSELTKQHKGDRNKILAAYNGGTRGLTDPLPETQKYIPKVTSLMDAGEDVTDEMNGKGSSKGSTSASSAKLPQVPQPPINPITGTTEEPSLSGFGKNVVTSGGRFLGDTAQGIWDLGKGAVNTGLELYNAPDKTAYLEKFGMNAIEKAPGVARNIYQYGKERYGGVTPILHTLYTDPVGAAADVSTLAGGGEFAAGKMLGKASRIAKTLGAVSAATDPFSVARIPARPKHAEKLMTEALKPGEQVLKRDPEIMQKGLKYDVGVSSAGLEANRARIDSLIKNLDESWSALSQHGKSADPFDVALSPEIDKLSQSYRSINPKPDWGTIDNTIQDFMNHWGPQSALSADEARDAIKHTYRKREGAYEGRAASVTAETEQALAKATLSIFQKHEEDLVQAGLLDKPIMKQTGAELSDRIRLEGLIQKAIHEEMGRSNDLLRSAGLSGGILAAALGNWGFAGTAIGLGTARSVLRRPDVRSALAQYWKKGHSLGGVKVAGVGPTVVGTAERATRDKQPQQVPLPPGMGNPSDVSLTIRSDGTDDVSDQMK